MTTNEEILTPKVLIVPVISSTAGFPAYCAIGTLVMSGAKLYVGTAVGTFEQVTSA